MSAAVSDSILTPVAVILGLPLSIVIVLLILTMVSGLATVLFDR